MDRTEKLQIRQLDDVLASFKELRERHPPDSGWTNVVRETLGMSIQQLATRIGMSKTAVASAENNEARGTVQMDTLRRLADGLECDLVYAIVPRTSLQDSIEKQALKKAGLLVGRVSDTMELENQGVSDSERRIQIEEIAEEILQTKGRDFWNG